MYYLARFRYPPPAFNPLFIEAVSRNSQHKQPAKCFQSSFHWGKREGCSSEGILMATFNPLFIEAEFLKAGSSIEKVIFQSSFHWGDDQIVAEITTNVPFQSSFHWGWGRSEGSKQRLGNLSILFSLRPNFMQCGTAIMPLPTFQSSFHWGASSIVWQDGEGMKAFNPLFIEAAVIIELMLFLCSYFQSSFHWGKSKQIASSCIQLPYFQSSFHWGKTILLLLAGNLYWLSILFSLRRGGRVMVEVVEIDIFQSSFHWGIYQLAAMLSSHGHLSILFSLRAY